jgi:Protein kinase domain
VKPVGKTLFSPPFCALTVKVKLLVRGLSNAQVAEEGRPLTGHFGYIEGWYAFTAPEIDNDFFHDKAVDLWSLGAFIYTMLTGLLPFRGSGDVLVGNKHHGRVEFDAVVPSEPAQRLVYSLLQVNPADRPTIEQVLGDEWMTAASDSLANHDLVLAKVFMSDWVGFR